MSDNDDIEVDSDEESPRYHSVADKRAHHNALERKRRDHIKDSFHSLRDSVPALQGEKQSTKQASLSLNLDKAMQPVHQPQRQCGVGRLTEASTHSESRGRGAANRKKLRCGGCARELSSYKPGHGRGGGSTRKVRKHVAFKALSPPNLPSCQHPPRLPRRPCSLSSTGGSTGDLRPSNHLITAITIALSLST
ncbi:protein max isoform X3 [Lates japonicus]|uniref:Protein max n=1 Tax=Lates japonicus TaxID=270547 RepID=A0AAD3QZQ0_LATJO|nr:protein max isoform X3 [Lates japonicus]